MIIAEIGRNHLGKLELANNYVKIFCLQTSMEFPFK